MILNPIDLSDSTIQQSLNFLHNSHPKTWDFYYRQYNTAMDYMLGEANKKKYLINRQFSSFMFLFRHTVELMLKTNVEKKGDTIDNTHKISSIASSLQFDLPKDFITLLDGENEGDCFRYLEDKNGNLFFNGEELFVLPALCYFTNVVNNTSDLFTIPLNNILNVEDKKIKNELTFHTNGRRHLGIVRTHYDFTISSLLTGVLNKEINMDQVYLPLLFLIRHGIELALKANLLDIEDELNQAKQSEIRSSHSLIRLFNILDKFIDEMIKNIPSNETKLLEDTHIYRQDIKILNDLINNIDTYSQTFRFPVDNNQNEVNFNPRKGFLFDVYQLYQKSDAYLTFAVPVLKQYI